MFYSLHFPIFYYSSKYYTIVDLTYKFDDKINDEVYTFVEICSTDCTHCQKCAEVQQQVADFFDDYEDDIRIGTASCRISPKICRDHEITQQPWWQLYYKGELIENYRGPRNAVVIIEWLKVYTGIAEDVVVSKDFGQTSNDEYDQ